jgi:hypothetical protein
MKVSLRESLCYGIAILVALHCGMGLGLLARYMRVQNPVSKLPTTEPGAVFALTDGRFVVSSVGTFGSTSNGMPVTIVAGSGDVTDTHVDTIPVTGTGFWNSTPEGKNILYGHITAEPIQPPVSGYLRQDATGIYWSETPDGPRTYVRRFSDAGT